MKFTLKNILILLFILIVDVVVYLFLGLMLMNYEDHYEASKGEYWALNSMNN